MRSQMKSGACQAHISDVQSWCAVLIVIIYLMLLHHVVCLPTSQKPTIPDVTTATPSCLKTGCRNVTDTSMATKCTISDAWNLCGSGRISKNERNIVYPRAPVKHQIWNVTDTSVTPKCTNSDGWNLRGSEWGCCGNYAGCCTYASFICYLHDAMCECCNSKLCGPDCRPEPECRAGNGDKAEMSTDISTTPTVNMNADGKVTAETARGVDNGYKVRQSATTTPSVNSGGKDPTGGEHGNNVRQSFESSTTTPTANVYADGKDAVETNARTDGFYTTTTTGADVKESEMHKSHNHSVIDSYGDKRNTANKLKDKTGVKNSPGNTELAGKATDTQSSQKQKHSHGKAVAGDSSHEYQRDQAVYHRGRGKEKSDTTGNGARDDGITEGSGETDHKVTLQ